MFNDMVNFVDNTAKSNKTAAYQFAVRGLLLENSLRQRKHIIQSVSLLAEELVIVGLHSRRPTRKPFPFPVIVQPFGALTWICLSVTLFVVAVSAIWTAYTFGPRPFGWRSILTFVAHGYLDYDVARRTPLPFKRETESSFIKRAKDRITVYRLAKHLIRITLQIVLIVFLLFYEMGVARVLFVAQRRPSQKDVGKLTKDELRLYSVEKNSAAEETWNLAVVGDGSKYNKTDKDKFPWRRCSPLSDCFDMVLDKTSIRMISLSCERSNVQSTLSGLRSP